MIRIRMIYLRRQSIYQPSRHFLQDCPAGSVQNLAKSQGETIDKDNNGTGSFRDVEHGERRRRKRIGTLRKRTEVRQKGKEANEELRQP